MRYLHFNKGRSLLNCSGCESPQNSGILWCQLHLKPAFHVGKRLACKEPCADGPLSMECGMPHLVSGV